MVMLLLYPTVRRCSRLSLSRSRDCIPSPRFTSPTLPAMRRLVGSHRYTWYVSVEQSLRPAGRPGNNQRLLRHIVPGWEREKNGNYI